MTTTSRADARVEEVQLVVRGRPARVFQGGAGDPLLLVHGGWGGARMHFSPVWDLLARRHRVIAPDLPGLGWVEQAALSSVAEYVEWLVSLLDALGVERAWCVGNSFGASLVWSLAGRAPGRCAGAVLVNGIPMPSTPAALRLIGRTRAARALMRRLLERWSYSRTAFPRAFADPARVPSELDHLVVEAWPLIVPRFADLLIAGDGPPDPAVKPLLLWGASDRLYGTTRRDGQRLHRRLRGSTLRWIEGAGHFPQLEAPEPFVAALAASIDA